MTLQEQIEKILDSIDHPTHKGGLIATNTVKGLHVDDQGKVAFILEFLSTQVEQGTRIREECIEKIKVLPGVTDVGVVLTADKKPRPKGNDEPFEKVPVEGVKHIILVASGKGGVGKSTTALNLACALSKMDLTVGLLDADVYGPSLPHMIGLNQRPESLDGKTMKPIRHMGLQCMSIGFMMAESMPAIWRGPMVQSAIQQMMRQVEWDNLDVLVVDLPPGTGDVPMTLTQNFPISGAVIVSTPQDLSLIDARKAVSMLTRMETHILGVIENMSYFQCPHCNERTDVFHHGGARKDAGELGVPFLGEIPLEPVIRETADGGEPIVIAAPQSKYAGYYHKIASQVWDGVNGLEKKKAA